MPDESYVICGDVDRMGNSLPCECAHCHVPLVISPATKADTEGATILCPECAEKVIGGDAEHVMGINQLIELLSRKGK